MSGSETGIIHNMHLAYGGDGTTVYKPAVAGSTPAYHPGNGAGNGGMGIDEEPLKKKRGRPRKYGPDGSMTHAIPVAPLSASAPAPAPAPLNIAPPPPSGTFSPPQSAPSSNQQPPHDVPQATGDHLSPPSNVSFKKSRGRPPGASKKHQSEVLGSLGINFTPHVITVKAGEDVSSRIMSFSQNGPRAICILSANGAISNVTLRQAATSGGSVTYEGRFEILSLSGSFMLSDIGGQRSRSGGLSVSLAGPDGRVLGGGVAGLLTAASPVQIVVGSFFPDCKRDVMTGNQIEPSSIPSKLHGAVGQPGAGSPPSRGTLSESSGGGPMSPLNQSTGGDHQGMHGGLPWK